MNVIQAPSLQQVKNFAVNRAGLEAITQTLYDHELYLAAGQAQMLFFSRQKGAGVTTAQGAVVGSVKSIADTNMELAGQMPAGKAFTVTGIEVTFRSGTSSAANTFVLANPSIFNAAAAAAVAAQVADINLFYNSGSLKFVIGSKTYLEEAPIGRFPPRTAVKTEAGIASNSATVGEVGVVNAAAVGRPYNIAPVLLENGQNFNIELNWPGVVAMTSTFNGRVGVILEGFMYRNSQ